MLRLSAGFWAMSVSRKRRVANGIFNLGSQCRCAEFALPTPVAEFGFGNGNANFGFGNSGLGLPPGMGNIAGNAGSSNYGLE